MAKVCQITGKKPSTGNTRSHAMNAKKRRFLPNLQKKKIVNPLTGETMTLRVSAKGLRNLSRNPLKWFKRVTA